MVAFGCNHLLTTDLRDAISRTHSKQIFMQGPARLDPEVGGDRGGGRIGEAFKGMKGSRIETAHIEPRELPGTKGS